MAQVRTALFLDFDNVFSGLYKIDPEAAVTFAREPGSWLSALERTFTIEGQRRWLVLRCYMNPSGSVGPPGSVGQARAYFSEFREPFTRAGFEVIDCPRLSSTKNAADIRLVLDAVDASMVVPAYDEFVIASGDSDMTPLLVRLRAADRRTTILSPSDAADAFTAVADRLIGADEVLALIQGELPDAEEEIPADAPIEEPGGALSRARALIRDRYANAKEPLNLARLASEVAADLSETEEQGILKDTKWFGAGSFAQFLTGLSLPHMRLSQHFLWDSSRHPSPPDRKPEITHAGSAVERITAEFKLPRLAEESWSPIYEALADYAKTHDFSLAEATKWGRDRLTERGIAVNRQAVGVVSRAAAFGGAPLFADPPPTAEEIGAAVVRNLLSRAEAAGMTLSEDDETLVRAWFGWRAAE